MRRRLSWVALFMPLLALTIWAQKGSDYHTGRLLTVTDDYDPASPSLKTNYLLHIRDGSSDYFARYKAVLLFGHDRSGQLKPDSDVQYRISNQDLFVKTSDSKEIKASLCKRVTYRGLPGVKYGGEYILEGEFGDSKAP